MAGYGDKFLSLTLGEWKWVKISDDIGGYPSQRTGQEKVELKLDRRDIYNWLRASGILEDDIPETLRAVPEPEASNQYAEGEELRALEALGLLAVTFAKGGGQYTHERSGKPNCAQVAEAMSQQARQGGEVYGMSKSKLQRLLSDALAAWEEKRG